MAVLWSRVVWIWVVLPDLQGTTFSSSTLAEHQLAVDLMAWLIYKKCCCQILHILAATNTTPASITTLPPKIASRHQRISCRTKQPVPIHLARVDRWQIST